MPKSNQHSGREERSKMVASVEDSLGCPRMVTRLWGMIVSIAYIASGGSLIAQSNEKNCKITGIYMLVLGIILVLAECPCFLIVIQANSRLMNFSEKYFPYWMKGLLYLILMLAPLILCFRWETMLVTLTMIILAILYFFLTCLQGSKRYERLRGEINYELNRRREEVSIAYNAFSHATATVNAFQSAAREHQAKESKSKHSAGRFKFPKKNRTQSDTTTYKTII